MDIADRFTEVAEPEIREALKEWALERVRHETALFRDGLRLFVAMIFIANAAGAMSVATIRLA